MIHQLATDPLGAARDATEYAELEHAVPMYRLQALCIAMEAFNILQEYEHVKTVYEVAVELEGMMIANTSLAKEIMARAKILVEIAQKETGKRQRFSEASKRD